MRRFIFALAVLGLSASLHAETYTWTGAVNALWNEPGNWSPAGAPAADDEAVFPAGVARREVGNYSETVAVRALSFGADYDLNLRIDLGSSLALTATPIRVDLGTLRLAGPNTWSVGEPVLNTVSSLSGSVDVGPHALEIIGGGVAWEPTPISGSGAVAAVQTTMTVRHSIGEFFSGTLDLARVIGYDGGMRGAVTARSVTGSGTFQDLVVLELMEPRSFTYNSVFQTVEVTLGDATSTAVYRRQLDQPLVTYSRSATLTNAALDVSRGSYRLHEREPLTLLRGETPVEGTFVGLPEGAEVTVSDQVYRIRYHARGWNGEHEVRLEWLRNTNTRTWTGAADTLWSNPANWSPIGIPAAGEALSFPEGGRLTTVNDLSVSEFEKLWIYDAYDISGNELVLALGIQGPMAKEVTIANDVRLASGSGPASLWGPLTFDGRFDVNGRMYVNALVGGETMTFDGPLTGAGSISMNWADTIAVRSPASDYSGSFAGGRLVLEASLPAASLDGTRAASDLIVNGEQSIGDVTLSASQTVTTPDERHGGVLVLNSSAGAAHGLVHTGSFRMGYASPYPYARGDAHYFVDVDASSSDQVDVSGPVWLQHARLTVNVVEPPSAGTVFTIVDNDGTDAVTGTFTSLPEGAMFTSGGVDFQISYVGGTGNDITLTVRASTVATSTTVSSTSASTPYGTRAVFHMSVRPAPAAGTVRLRIDGREVADLPVVDGGASFTMSSLDVGPHTIAAIYSGTASHEPSTSATITHVIAKATPAVELTRAPATVTAGVPFTIALTVAPSGAPPTSPAGEVAVFLSGSGNTVLGVGSLADGSAAVAVTLAQAGDHVLTVWYAGNTHYEPAGASYRVKVVAPPGKRRVSRK